MMSRRSLLPILVLLALGAPAMAQESGGVPLAPNIKGGPVGLARPLPFTRPPLVTAQDLQGSVSPADRRAQHQDMISRLRGDPGFLSGFSFGTPLALSRQPQASLPDDGGYRYRHSHGGHGAGPIIINNDGPLAVTVGNGNVVQQQSASGSGPIALQQVSTTASGGKPSGGAVNRVTGAGNIVQRAPDR
jgi:hypothetical protein